MQHPNRLVPAACPASSSRRLEAPCSPHRSIPRRRSQQPPSPVVASAVASCSIDAPVGFVAPCALLAASSSPNVASAVAGRSAGGASPNTARHRSQLRASTVATPGGAGPSSVHRRVQQSVAERWLALLRPCSTGPCGGATSSSSSVVGPLLQDPIAPGSPLAADRAWRRRRRRGLGRTRAGDRGGAGGRGAQAARGEGKGEISGGVRATPRGGDFSSVEERVVNFCWQSCVRLTGRKR